MRRRWIKIQVMLFHYITIRQFFWLLNEEKKNKIK